MYQSHEAHMRLSPHLCIAVLTLSLLSTQSQASSLHLAAEGSISVMIFDGNISRAAQSLTLNWVWPQGGQFLVRMGVCLCVWRVGFRGGIFVFAVVSICVILHLSAHGQNERHTLKERQWAGRQRSTEDWEWQIKWERKHEREKRGDIGGNWRKGRESPRELPSPNVISLR